MGLKKSRRQFLETGLKIGMTAPFLNSSLFGCLGRKPAARKLKILILGGTSFLGPHQIAYALERGHHLTTFTRGKTQPTIHVNLFKYVEQLVGDRENNLKALEGKSWDVVIDNSGRKVEWTQNTADLLKDSCDLYVYTSSTGVYYPYITGKYETDDPVLLSLPEGVDEELKFIYDYGIMKANSELVCRKAFGNNRTIIVRPTYMIGPGDKSNRFIHWPIRLSKGGEILLPGKEMDMVQYIDVRDVAEWMIRLVEERKTGTYNAAGPEEKQSIHDFAIDASRAFDVKTDFVKVDDYNFLKENDIRYIVPWIMTEGNNRDTAKISNSKAFDNGLTCRSLVKSTRDTYDWWYSDALSQEYRDKYEKDTKGLLVREKEVLKNWKSR